LENRHYALYKPLTDELPRNHTLGVVGERKMAQMIAQKAGYGANSDTFSPLMATAVPEVIPMFIRAFPFFEALRKVPANGISHTWSQWTSFTQTQDPNTISETGFVNDDANTYVRKTTNIAIFAIRRSASLKANLAGMAQGLNLYDREVSGGILTMGRDVQMESLRYQETYADLAHGYNGATPLTPTQWTAASQNPDGKYDPNGFNGLRYIAQNEAPPENTIQVDVSAAGNPTGGWTDHRVLMGVRQVVDNLADKGGRADMLIATTTGATMLMRDHLSFVRIVITGGMSQLPGIPPVQMVSTNQGDLPLFVIPGYHLGSYVSGGNTFQDIFVLNSEDLEMPYLGNPEPSVLTIPMGVNGQLVQMAIVYCMYGLVSLAPSLNLGRVQLKLQ
jgi:hypothetical protein